MKNVHHFSFYFFPQDIKLDSMFTTKATQSKNIPHSSEINTLEKQRDFNPYKRRDCG